MYCTHVFISTSIFIDIDSVELNQQHINNFKFKFIFKFLSVATRT